MDTGGELGSSCPIAKHEEARTLAGARTEQSRGVGGSIIALELIIHSFIWQRIKLELQLSLS